MPKLQKNARAIASAAAGPKLVYQIDGAPGLNLAALGNGKASWRLRYRPARGVEKRWHTIGDASTITLGDAIGKARVLMSALQLEGIDPRAELDAPKGMTFDDLFQQWLERRAKQHKKSWQEDVRLYDRHVKCRIGARVASEVTRREIIDQLTDIASKATPIQANRCLSVISVVFSWAVAVEMVEQHPAMRIPKPGIERVRDRVLSHVEIAAIWNALDDILRGQREGMTPRLARLLQVLILTGQRKSEVTNMQASELAGEIWIIPSERMKGGRQHAVPLAPVAHQTIRAAISESAPNPRVFPGKDGGLMEPMSVGHALGRLTKSLGLEDVRPHDLRRTCASEMGRLGVQEQVISRVLSHVQSGVTATHYNMHGYMDEKRAALQKWETELTRIAAIQRDQSTSHLGAIS